MSQKQAKKKETIDINLLFSNTGTRLINVFTTNIVVIGVFSLIGYLLDIEFETKPIFLFIFIVLSFPASIMLIVRQAKKMTEKLSKKDNHG